MQSITCGEVSVPVTSSNEQQVIGMLLAHQAEQEEGDLEIAQPPISEVRTISVTICGIVMLCRAPFSLLHLNLAYITRIISIIPCIF